MAEAGAGRRRRRGRGRPPRLRRRVVDGCPARERAKYLFRIARAIQERGRELAVLESLDNGKPIKESRDVDIPTAAAHFFYYAGWADKLDYAGFGADPRPLGVAGQIIPWNFPLLMAAWKIAPGAGHRQHRRAQAGRDHAADRADAGRDHRRGRPAAGRRQRPGRRPGDRAGARRAPPASTRSPSPARPRSASCIQRRLAGTGKRLTLELGGKAANIVFDDAPLDQAVEGIVNGIFFNQGHVCCAGSRLLVQESVADEVLDRAAATGCRRCGWATRWTRTPTSARSTRPPSWPGSASWPTPATPRARTAGRRRARCPTAGSGSRRRCSPASRQANRIAREEIFGPVLSVLTFRTPDEAVEKANNTPYGLSAGIWTEKGSRILWMAQQLRAGVVWANTFNRFDPASPFGGYKESGFGREGGRHGLAAYLDEA